MSRVLKAEEYKATVNKLCEMELLEDLNGREMEILERLPGCWLARVCSSRWLLYGGRGVPAGGSTPTALAG